MKAPKTRTFILISSLLLLALFSVFLFVENKVLIYYIQELHYENRTLNVDINKAQQEIYNLTQKKM